MADYGLAAQIGRGAGGNVMGGQQPDPTNRMMQMLQLQQLQQNMMLAREQEAREAALAPLRRQAVETSIRADEATIPGKVDQSTSARLQRQSAERAGTAEVGALDYIRTTPPEERVSAERLDALRRTNPGAYQVVSQSIAQARAVQEKARAEGFTAERQRFELQKVALAGMSSLLPAVRDQDSYQTLYKDYRLVDPVGAKLIGPEYTPQNVEALRARVQDLADLKYGTDEQGNQIVTNQRLGTVTLLAPAVRPAPPSTSTFGNLGQPLAQPPVSPQMAGGPAAAALVGPGVMQPPNAAENSMPSAAPIIQPRAPAPTSAVPAFEGLGPKPTAQGQQTFATETAKSAVVSEDRRRGAGEVLKAISDPKLDKLIMGSTSGRGERFAAEIPAFFGVSTSGMEKIGRLGTIESQITTQLLGGKLGSGISNADVNLIREGVGQISNPNVPANQRLAALKQLRNNLKALSEGKEIAIDEPGSKAALKLSPDVDALLKKYQ